MLHIAFAQNLLNSNTHLQELLKTYFNGAHISERQIELALLSDKNNSDISYVYVLKQWRDLVAVILLLKFQNLLTERINSIILKRSRFLRSITIWPERQVMTLYPLLANALTGKSRTKFDFSQSASGYCPDLFFDNSAFGELPTPIYHAELAILLYLYGQACEDSIYIDAAIKMAEWQKNTFDFDFNPFVALFSKEGESSEFSLLLLNFSLFSLIGKIATQEEAKAIGEIIAQKIEKLEGTESSSTSVLAIVLANYCMEKLDRNRAVNNLPQVIFDESQALVGVRSSKYSVISTLYGNNSGMGSLHIGDVKIVNYAPQCLPLGEFQGFGLEGGNRLLAHHLKHIQASEHSFELDGSMRVKACQGDENSSIKDSGGTWIDARQAFKEGVLDISISSNDNFKNETLAFVFFVKCQTCEIKPEVTIKLKSFDRYQGNADTLFLNGVNSTVTIKSARKDVEMHVIPLGGGDSFWGADFLVAYYLNPSEKEFSWQVF